MPVEIEKPCGIDGPGLLKVTNAVVDQGVEPLYLTLPPRLIRAEMESGRLRWSKDNIVDDFIFYLRCNHELIGLVWTPESHPTDRPTRVLLLCFSFCFGLMFEVVLGEIMGENTRQWVVGMVLGILLSFWFWIMEQFFTCGFIRKKMDEDEQDRLEKGQEGLQKDDKNVRETLFCMTRCLGCGAGCCLFAPGALICYWGAIFIMAAQRDIGVVESIGVTTTIWCTGYASGAVYSVFWCAMMFYYHVEYKGASFEAVKAIRSKQEGGLA
mmetsp:Transcript_11833/g.24207  ORF Transcript_11833/g.24207 Transcript_11833/m.24207 type:complete len:268 (+) Transcript_11833:43-846(+)